MYNRRKVLIVDAEERPAFPYFEILSDDGYDVCASADVEMAINMIHQDDIAVIITDTRMRCSDGTQFFEYVTENYPDIPVIFKPACKTEEHVFPAKTRNAFCYLENPPDYKCLKSILDSAIEQRFLKSEFESLQKSLMDKNIRYRIIGNTAEMRRIFEVIEEVKDSDSNVLICGEAGSGKELIARAINNLGKTHGPFIAVNCSAMPKEIIESELFGCAIDVFSGTFSKSIAKFDEVPRRTIFLDEIGNIELSLQAKLLKVLQEKEVQSLGSNRQVKGGFRIISSSKRDLSKEVQKGNFRDDLFFRINQTEIAVPPLRERKYDIPLLVSAFINEFCARDKKTLTITDSVMKAFENYNWPGNVRQLRNIIEKAVILAPGDKITLKELPEEVVADKRIPSNNNALKTFKEMEMEALQNALQACKGNKSKASKILGISRKAMYKRLRERQA